MRRRAEQLEAPPAGGAGVAPPVARGSAGLARQTASPSASVSTPRAAAATTAAPAAPAIAAGTAPPFCKTTALPATNTWIGEPTFQRIRREAPGVNGTLIGQGAISRGQGVRFVQQAVQDWGCETLGVDLLPRFGADGAFGRETQAAIETFQGTVGVGVDGLVGPITLAKLDQFVLAGVVDPGLPDIGRQAGAAPAAAPVAAGGPAIPVSEDATVSKAIASISMNGTAPTVRRRESASKSTVSIELDKPLKFSGRVTFKQKTALGPVELGFFQLGRPFETIRVTYARNDGVVDPNPNIVRDASADIRKDLPAQDHADVFFTDPTDGSTNPLRADVKPSNLSFSVNYSDLPHTGIQEQTLFNGVSYRVSGISTESFLFTGFGMVRNGRALILGTRFWDMKYCETIGPTANLAGTRSGASANVSPLGNCNGGTCNMGEPGARSKAGSAPGWGNTTSKTYVSVASGGFDNALFKGPARISINCAGSPG